MAQHSAGRLEISMFDEKYLSVPQISCFDNDTGAGDPPAGDPPAGDPPAGDPPADAGDAGDGKTFDTAAVNKIVEERLARDRKNRDAATKAEYRTLESSYNELLEHKSLSDDDRTKAEERLASVQNQLRTKEERAKHEKDQLVVDYETQLKTERESRKIWEDRFHNSSIDRALQDAAVSNDAYNNDHLVQLLRPMTKLTPILDEVGTETGRFDPVVDFPDHDEKGERVTFSGTPDEIVKRMKEIRQHANLFRSNVVSGLGANNATGGAASGPGGSVDVSKLTPEQYRKLRKEDPKLVGM
jgi:hypothetical protein